MSKSLRVTNDQKKHVRKQLNGIRKAFNAKKLTHARFLAMRYLRSHDAKCCAVRKAYYALDPDRRPALTELPKIATQLNAWAGSQEPVKVHKKLKSSGDYRTIMNFGIEHRALQYLVGSALAQMSNLHPAQYGVVGSHAAVKCVIEVLKTGPMFAVEVDIKDCYPSFDGEAVTSMLLLPEKVSRNVLISKYLPLIGGNLHDWFGPAGDDPGDPEGLGEELADARRGVPQGSAASPFLAEALIAPVLYALPQVGIVVAYADNILLLANTEEDVVSMKETLWSGLMTHPAGQLWPNEKIFSPGQPIRFLGHDLTAQAPGVVDVRPAEKNLQEFYRRMGQYLHRIEHEKCPQRRKRKIGNAQHYVQSWTRGAFKLCDGMDDFRKKWLAKIPPK